MSDCPHAAPFRYCPTCVVSPCPIGLGGTRTEICNYPDDCHWPDCTCPTEQLMRKKADLHATTLSSAKRADHDGERSAGGRDQPQDTRDALKDATEFLGALLAHGKGGLVTVNRETVRAQRDRQVAALRLFREELP